MKVGRWNFFLKNAGISKWGNTRAYNEEFSTEMYDKTYNTSNMPPFNSYSVNGIHTEKVNDHLKIRYDGILAKSGAKDVYAVTSCGDNKNWNDVRHYPMQPTGYQTFEALIPLSGNKGINIAFKDGADNWDNNSGANYSFNSSFYAGSH
jgi:hypothetical protein